MVGNVNGDNKNNLIALFVTFLKSPESEEYRKYIGWYVSIYIRDNLSTFAYFPNISQENNLIHKMVCFTIWLFKKRKQFGKSVIFSTVKLKNCNFTKE